MDAEERLIDRVLAGEPAAERELYDAHVDRVFRLAYRMTGDEHLAREYTQQTFIRAFERLPEFRRESRLSTWLHAIGVSVVLNGLRKVKRFRRREVSLEHAATLRGPDRGIEPDVKERLREEIDALPEKYRLVFVMHEIEGYSHEEIGNVLGVATGTSKARLSRARARLREALSEFAGEYAT